MSVKYVRDYEELHGLNRLSAIDRALFLLHNWRFVVFVNGQPESVHSSWSEAQRYLFESEIER